MGRSVAQGRNRERRWPTAPLAVVGSVTLLSCATVAGTSEESGAAVTTFPPIIRPAPVVPPGCAEGSTVSTLPAPDLDQTQQRVIAFVRQREEAWPGTFQGIGTCAPGVLWLQLGAGGEHLAAAVRKAFGPSVQISINGAPWDGHPIRSPLCGTLSPPTPGAPYTAHLVLPTARLAPGAVLEGHIVFQVTGGAPVSVSTGSMLESVLVVPGTLRVVGMSAVPIAGTGQGFVLSPGRTGRVGVVVGTARCDGKRGSTVPAGRYDVIAEISGPAVTGVGPNGAPTPMYYTAPLPVRVG